MPASPSPVILETGSAPDAAVIWLHGLGADGHDFEPVVPALALPASLPVRFIFPHAPVRPVTINGGMAMRAWYDIIAFDGVTEDETGIRASQQLAQDLITAQVGLGIASERIIIAGFSQGGAIALQAGLRHPTRLAGILALSTYLPLRASLAAERSESNQDTPLLMIHGSHDEIVSADRGRSSRDAMVKLGQAVDWREYPMGHELCMPEVHAISTWLQQVLSN